MNMDLRINGIDNYPNFDWDLTRNFYFVIKIGFFEASKKLGLTQSDLIEKIECLEEKLGFPLIFRHEDIMPVSLTLTERGKALVSFLDLIQKSLVLNWVSESY